MDIRIGMQHSPRELTLKSEQSAEEVEALIDEALTNQSVLRLTDHKGNRYLVPATALAYVELGTEETRKIGFA